MATGDQADQKERMAKLLPPWFGDSFPLVSAVLTGIALAAAFIYDLITYARLQTRVQTATGNWLDLIASDFFGDRISRSLNQSDAAFRSAILADLFQERGTRAAVASAVTALTGRAPEIFEPSRVQDTGGYGAPVMGYGAAGHYGSMLLPYQAFITAYRPANSGIPSVAGYGSSVGAYRTPSRAEYASTSMIEVQITDEDILAAIDAVKPVGTIMWVRIGNTAPSPAIPLNYSLILNGSQVQLNSTNLRVLGWAN